MGPKLLLLTLVSVSLSAIAQITLKAGMSSPKLAASLAGGDLAPAVLAAIGRPCVVAGLGLYFLGALVWLGVLSQVDVSVAYPFVGFGFLLTAAFAALFLGEEVGLLRLLGTGMIAAGVYLVAQS